MIYLDYAKRVAKATKHFCSAHCKRASHTGQQNPHYRGGPQLRTCKACTKKFGIYGSVRPDRGQYCSRRCKVASQTKYASARERSREGGRRYETRKRAIQLISGHHTKKEWVLLLTRFDGKCAKCGSPDKITRDHIVPLSRGGSDLIGNIQPLCKSCNSKKWRNLE